MKHKSLRDEVAHNFGFFQRRLSQVMPEHTGQYALLKAQEIIGYFDKPGDADREGARRFADGIYSVQRVTAEPVELGLYANAKP